MRIALGLLTVASSIVVLHCSAGLPYVCHGALECGLEADGGPEGGQTHSRTLRRRLVANPRRSRRTPRSAS